MSTADDSALPSARADLLQRVADTCRKVAPTWPLDRFIAVNPHWGRIDEPFEQVGRQLARTHGSRLWMPRKHYLDAWTRGTIGPDDLAAALAELSPESSPSAALAALRDDSSPLPLPLLTDCLDANDPRRAPAWRDAITHQVSQHCAAFFDRDQSDWRAGGTGSLYATWLDTVRHDHGMAHLMNAPHWTRRVRDLPADRFDCIARALAELEVPQALVPELLDAVLARIGGWASWCAYRRWQAGFAGTADDTLEDLLAIRLASEVLADDGERGPGSAWQEWQAQLKSWLHRAPGGFDRFGPVWQRAHEVAYQRTLVGQLSAPSTVRPAARPLAQALFCIDVRSEVFRRALEQADPGMQTLGFAGFFGLPIAFTPLGTAARRPQLPGPLAPAIEAVESSGSPADDAALHERRRGRLRARQGWDSLGRWPASAFAWVETMGLAYVPSLLRRSFARDPRPAMDDQQGLRPAESARLAVVLAVEPEQRAPLAARVLRAMSLTSGFARLVLLVGHGSSSANNPHAAGLDCGACCGQTGEVNARALATLLNDPAVRAGLRATEGIDVPEDTWFVPALHDTTLDEVRLFDSAALPESHRHDLARVSAAFERAGLQTRAARAPDMGLASGDADELRAAVRQRAADWAQTRPEWGLANNAAFIAAPRTRTAALDLGGRAFLHEYDWRLDAGEDVLELIMTAPVVVAHWINLQYFASTVDPRRYGSGNKVLHNVVGGRIGVFEGNGGDLRIGLPLQSVHDGRRWMHEPLRLSVFVAAPRAALERILAKHEVVRQLVVRRWLHLYRLDDDGRVERYTAGDWIDVTAKPRATDRLVA